MPFIDIFASCLKSSSGLTSSPAEGFRHEAEMLINSIVYV